jgi:hypothetical protein
VEVGSSTAEKLARLAIYRRNLRLVKLLIEKSVKVCRPIGEKMFPATRFTLLEAASDLGREGLILMFLLEHVGSKRK